MNKERLINRAYVEIEHFRDKFGEIFYDAIQEDDNSTYEMAKGIIYGFSGKCHTKKEFEIADSMLMAICGYSFETLIERIKKLDAESYMWKSCS